MSSMNTNKFSGGYVGLDFDSVDNDQMTNFSSDMQCYSQFEIANHLETIMHFLGSKDRDIVYMFFVLKKRQNDIAEILKKTQAAVSYDTNRIKEQIEFIIYLVSVVDEFLMFLEDNRGKFSSEDCDILTLMFFTSSYTQSAKILNVNKISLRNKFFKILERLDLKYEKMHEVFLAVSKNLNKIKKTHR